MSDYRFRGKRPTPTEMREKLKTKRNSMPEQEPKVRCNNFEEVNLGYDAETAIREAKRCLLCLAPQCVKGCPVKIKIPEFIDLIAKGEFMEALNVMKRDNALPAVTGRVCPQETQCEGVCAMGKGKNSPVGIGYLERFIADFERKSDIKCCMEKEKPTGKKAAIIGSGPGGLTAAADLARMGHEVHIFEALHKGGGVLVYGIPEFRLPKEIVEYEIDALQEAGVKLHTNAVIGKLFTIEELKKEEGFDTIFIGVGAGAPRFLGLDGENLNGVFSANEFLTRSNLMKGYQFPEFDTPIKRGRNVTVVGGGNVAMDAARTALRLGANVTIVYRRAREQMPARDEEIMHGEEEGIDFKLLTNPIGLEADENGWVKNMECIQMELGEPDDSGRRRPVPVEGSNFKIETDLVIIAIGSNANPLLTATVPDLKLNRWGNIETDKKGRTSVEGVWAGGDIVTGAATVIEAMGAGRTAAEDMNTYLKEGFKWVMLD